jgi:exosortase K
VIAVTRPAIAMYEPIRWRVLTMVAVLTVIWAGKHFYSHASAHELRWILAPTAQLVSWISGADYIYERGVGWVSLQHAFIIAPACAGMNFALAGFLALAWGSLARMNSLGSLLVGLPAIAGFAYVATLMVNTVRIVIAIALHHRVIEFGDASAADIHRAEGILVYLLGLCGLFAAAQAMDRRVSAAMERVG